MNSNKAIGLVITLSVIHYSVMGYSGYSPSVEATVLMDKSLIFMFAWWAFEDAREQHYHRPYEFGAFIFFAWPVVLPAYLVATRGWRGLSLFPIFLFLYTLPSSMGWVAYYLNPLNQ